MPSSSTRETRAGMTSGVSKLSSMSQLKIWPTIACRCSGSFRLVAKLEATARNFSTSANRFVVLVGMTVFLSRM